MTARSRTSRGHRRPVLRRALAALALTPFARAATTGARFAASAETARRRARPIFPDVPAPTPTAALAASVALDELFMMPTGLFASMIRSADYAQSSAELDAAVRFYDAQGWLDDPSGYFEAPPPPQGVTSEQISSRRGPVELVSFASEWQPREGEPGRERWETFTANRTAYAHVLRHDDKPRPWLVCLHGARMGTVRDIDTFRLRRLHHDLGLNLVLPTLPLHGRRAAGWRPKQQFVSTVYPLNNVHGMAQAVWDTRRFVRWLREEQGATRVGVFGFSLGSYVASVLSTMEGDLDALIAVVPSGDFAAPLKATEPAVPKLRRLHVALHDWRARLVQDIVSPLARPCVVPQDRRFILAASGDRLATAPGGAMLWRHWDRPSIDWYPRGHLTIATSAGYEDRLKEILQKTGFAAT